jgi:hypothetical protein
MKCESTDRKLIWNGSRKNRITDASWATDGPIRSTRGGNFSGFKFESNIIKKLTRKWNTESCSKCVCICWPTRWATNYSSSFLTILSSLLFFDQLSNIFQSRRVYFELVKKFARPLLPWCTPPPRVGRHPVPAHTNIISLSNRFPPWTRKYDRIRCGAAPES